MKKLLLLVPLALLVHSIAAQQTDPARLQSKEDYLRKSKTQKKTAWILLGGGTALAVTGAIIFGTTYDDGGSFATTDVGGILILVGLAMDLASIPFFASSAKNARRAASLSMTNQPLLIPAGSAWAVRAVPSLSLRIGL